MPYLEFHKLQLFYEEQGEGEPFVFLHGLGSDHQQALSLLEDLDEYRVISIDMPGHGNTLLEDYDSELCFDFFGDAVISLLNHLNIEQCIMGGISMGSGITLNVALRDPLRISKLILVRPAWVDKTNPEHLDILIDIGRWIEEHGIEEAGKLLLQHETFQEMNNDCPLSAQGLQALLTRPQAKSGAPVLYRMCEDRPFTDLAALASLKQEAIVCGNDRDDLHPVSIANQIKEALPNAHYVHLPERYVVPEAYQRALVQAIKGMH